MSENSNISPSFARDASRFLREGNIQRAVELCVEGTKAFPKYPTGHLILGKCFEAFGRHVEALVEYRKALQILPDNGSLQALVKNVEEKEKKEFGRFSEEQERKLHSRRESISTAEFLAEEPPKEESAIDYLAKRLQDVKRIQPNQSSTGVVSAPIKDERSVRFVTATMAEIYVGQGEYAEAINAYQELLRDHPEEQEKHRVRIGEIEQLLAIQQREKSLEQPQNKKAS